MENSNLQLQTLDNLARLNNFQFPFFVKLFDPSHENHGIVLRIESHTEEDWYHVPEIPLTLKGYRSDPSNGKGWIQFYPEVQSETRKVYINIYESQELDTFYKDKERADRHAFPERIECVEVTYKVHHKYEKKN